MERRQVFDLPEAAVAVTEHQLIERACGCGQRTRAAAPPGGGAGAVRAADRGGHRVPVRREVVMNPIRTIRRLTVMLAGLTGSLLALSTGAPAAFAYVLPPHPSSGGTAGPPPAQAIVTSGMPGWQITLIAAAAAILAATAAVLLDRVRAARRHQTAPSA
jgi:hypothetical protein